MRSLHHTSMMSEGVLSPLLTCGRVKEAIILRENLPSFACHGMILVTARTHWTHGEKRLCNAAIKHSPQHLAPALRFRTTVTFRQMITFLHPVYVDLFPLFFHSLSTGTTKEKQQKPHGRNSSCRYTTIYNYRSFVSTESVISEVVAVTTATKRNHLLKIGCAKIS
jgi:hypothetical protein